MLHDGYWKRELIKFKRQLKYWSRRGGYYMYEYSEHRINRCLLYSAAIIRKIVEDEANAQAIMKKNNWQMAPFKILHYTVPIKVYKHTDEDKFFMVSKLILPDYDTKHCESADLPLKEACNQIIHSFVWSPVHSGKKSDIIYGAMFASDREKEKCAYLLKIEDWINTLDFVAQNCHINSKESII